MTPETPDPREALEARLTALLLGELSGAEAAALRQAIEDDPALARLHDQMAQTIKLVREVSADPAAESGPQPAPLRMSDDKRQKLLAQFKTVKPREFESAKPGKFYVSPLIKIAAMVAIMAILAGLIAPVFSRAKSKSIGTSARANLRQIDAAKQMWAEENKAGPDATPTMEDLKPYLGWRQNEGKPTAIAGETYIVGKVGEPAAAEVSASDARKAFGRAPESDSTHGRNDQVMLFSDGKVEYADARDRSQSATALDLAVSSASAALLSAEKTQPAKSAGIDRSGNLSAQSFTFGNGNTTGATSPRANIVLPSSGGTGGGAGPESPVNLAEGYRFNTRTLNYSYDPSLTEYFSDKSSVTKAEDAYSKLSAGGRSYGMNAGTTQEDLSRYKNIDEFSGTNFIALGLGPNDKPLASDPIHAPSSGGDKSDNKSNVLLWGSLDGSTQAPKVYPEGTSLADLQSQPQVYYRRLEQLAAGTDQKAADNSWAFKENQALLANNGKAPLQQVLTGVVIHEGPETPPPLAAPSAPPAKEIVNVDGKPTEMFRDGNGVLRDKDGRTLAISGTYFGGINGQASTQYRFADEPGPVVIVDGKPVVNAGAVDAGVNGVLTDKDGRPLHVGGTIIQETTNYNYFPITPQPQKAFRNQGVAAWETRGSYGGGKPQDAAQAQTSVAMPAPLSAPGPGGLARSPEETKDTLFLGGANTPLAGLAPAGQSPPQLAEAAKPNIRAKFAETTPADSKALGFDRTAGLLTVEAQQAAGGPKITANLNPDGRRVEMLSDAEVVQKNAETTRQLSRGEARQAQFSDSDKVPQFGDTPELGRLYAEEKKKEQGEEKSSVMKHVSGTVLSGYVDTSAEWNPGTGNAHVENFKYNAGKSDGANLDSILVDLEKPGDPNSGTIPPANPPPALGEERGRQHAFVFDLKDADPASVQQVLRDAFPQAGAPANATSSLQSRSQTIQQQSQASSASTAPGPSTFGSKAGKTEANQSAAFINNGTIVIPSTAANAVTAGAVDADLSKGAINLQSVPELSTESGRQAQMGREDLLATAESKDKAPGAVINTDSVPAQEAVRREYDVLVLRKKMQFADAERKAGNIEQANKLYRESKVLADKIGPFVESEKKESEARLSEGLINQAEAAGKRHNYAKADDLYAQALKLDPSNQSVARASEENRKLVDAQAGRVPSKEALSKLPTFRTNDVNVATSVQDGKFYYEAGRLDEAEDKLNRALQKDPSSVAANYYMRLIKEKRMADASRRSELASADALLQVEKSWDVEERNKLKSGEVDAPQVPLEQALELYGKLTGREIVRSAALPQGAITLKTPQGSTTNDAIQALETALAMNGVVTVNVGDKFVKAVPTQTTLQNGTPLTTTPNAPLPETNPKVRELKLAEAELEREKKFYDLLALHTAQEKVEERIPKSTMVEIIEHAEGKSPARIKVERDVMDVPGVDGRGREESSDPYFVATEQEVIKSQRILDKVIDNLGLKQAWSEREASGQALNEAQTRQLLRQKLDIQPSKRANSIVSIAVKGEKPEEAAKIANAVAQAYEDYRHEERTKLLMGGIEAYKNQMVAQAEVVKQGEAKVEALKLKVDALKRNLDVTDMDPQNTANVPGMTLEPMDVMHYNSVKIEKEKEATQKESMLNSLKALKPEELRQTLPTTVPDQVLTTLLQDSIAAQNKLVALQNDHGPDHPDVKRAQTLVTNLDGQIDQRVAGIMQGLETEVQTAKAIVANVDKKIEEAKERAPYKPATPTLTPQPEVSAAENAFSTFSLNVSDVAFKLAGASLEKGVMPDAGNVRAEEFINAFDYRDPEPAPGAPLAFAWERVRYPFAQNRDLLRFAVKTAAAGRQPGRPLNIVLLLDNSGSMERADRVAIIRQALRVLATKLEPQDVLSVVTFARTAHLRVDGVSGSQAGQVAEEIGGLTPQGGTNLEEAMRLAYETARRHYLAGGVNRVVLMTDGAANLGNVDPVALKQDVDTNRKQGIALDCFGIGWEGYNDDLLETLSRNGDGRYAFINTPEEAATDFVGQLAGALNVAASDVKVQVEFNPKRVTTYRQIGYAKHQLKKEEFRDNSVNAAQIGAAESGNALYTAEVNPGGEGPIAIVRVRFRVPGTQDYREHEWEVPYQGNALGLEQASIGMRLAGTASAFAEWLGGSPFAGEVTPDRLLSYLRGVPEAFGADQRPQKLEWMIRQAKSLTGK